MEERRKLVEELTNATLRVWAIAKTIQHADEVRWAAVADAIRASAEELERLEKKAREAR